MASSSVTTPRGMTVMSYDCPGLVTHHISELTLHASTGSSACFLGCWNQYEARKYDIRYLEDFVLSYILNYEIHVDYDTDSLTVCHNIIYIFTQEYTMTHASHTEPKTTLQLF